MTRTRLTLPLALFVALGVSITTFGCGSSDSQTVPLVQEHQSVQVGTADRARVTLGMDAGDFEVKSGASNLMDADFSYNVLALKPEIAYAVNNGEGELRVSQSGGGVSGNYENKWHVSLKEGVPMDLRLNLGAGDAQFTLGRLNLTALDIAMGAGDLVVDLRGTPTKSYSVSVKAGAGDTTVKVPSTVGISARATGGIGGVTVTGLEQRDGRWVNTKVTSPPVTIDISVTHGIGDLKIEAE